MLGHNFTEICIYFINPMLEFDKSISTSLFDNLQLEKAMATHSSTLAWKIPWMEEPGRTTQSTGSQRVGHD